MIGSASSDRDVSIFPFSKSIFFFTNVTYCHRICIKLLLLYYFSALYAIYITARGSVNFFVLHAPSHQSQQPASHPLKKSRKICAVHLRKYYYTGITYHAAAPAQSDIGLCRSKLKAL